MPLVHETDYFLDGDFTYAHEVEGSPSISVDEVTQAKIITRLYAILTDYYEPLPQDDPDPVYANAYLITEQAAGIQGPIFFFQRIYAEIPDTRTEHRAVSFTIPGKSKVDTSAETGSPVGWNQYGAASPGTYSLKADVIISYALGPDAPTLPVTAVLYNGAPVDFIGSVYEYIGNHTVEVSPGNNVFEPLWLPAGVTVPNTMPIDWIAEVNVTRWRGNIWQYEQITVHPSL